MSTSIGAQCDDDDVAANPARLQIVVLTALSKEGVVEDAMRTPHSPFRLSFVVTALVAAAVTAGGCVTAGVEYTGAGSSADEVADGAPDPEFGSISPYGRWWYSDGYGWVFTPAVDAGWRPYTYGHWAASPDGWLWVSDEPFGWATYHYGRWVFVDGSWAWLPGHRWAPAWVAWTGGPEAVGWVPLGMEAYPASYVVVERRDFLEPGVYHHVMPAERNAAFVRSSGVVHHAPDRAIVERDAGRRAPYVSHDEARRVEPRARPVSSRPVARPTRGAVSHRGHEHRR